MCAPPILPDEAVLNAVASHDGAGTGTGTAGQVTTACGHKPCLALDTCCALSAKKGWPKTRRLHNHDLIEPCCLRITRGLGFVS